MHAQSLGHIAVWQGVAMVSLRFYAGLPCPTLLNPAGRPALRAACGHLLPLWTPHAVRLCWVIDLAPLRLRHGLFSSVAWNLVTGIIQLHTN
jgi:hypothetical protein